MKQIKSRARKEAEYYTSQAMKLEELYQNAETRTSINYKINLGYEK